MADSRSLMEKPKSELASQLASMRNRMSRVRETAREKTQLVVGAMVGGGAAYGAGYFAKEYPEHMKLGETEVPTLAAASVVLFAAGVAELAGDQSSYLVEAGKGLGYGYLALKASGHGEA